MSDFINEEINELRFNIDMQRDSIMSLNDDIQNLTYKIDSIDSNYNHMDSLIYDTVKKAITNISISNILLKIKDIISYFKRKDMYEEVILEYIEDNPSIETWVKKEILAKNKSVPIIEYRDKLADNIHFFLYLFCKYRGYKIKVDNELFINLSGYTIDYFLTKYENFSETDILDFLNFYSSIFELKDLLYWFTIDDSSVKLKDTLKGYIQPVINNQFSYDSNNSTSTLINITILNAIFIFKEAIMTYIYLIPDIITNNIIEGELND